MKNRIPILAAVLICMMLLAGCSCQHQWTEADCTAPKSCTLCQITEGEALGHSWQEADCVTPKTCSRCDLTEGTALGHSWEEATCTAPKTCSVCSATEGQPLEHIWEGEATLYTAPVCSVCGIDGDPLPGYLAQNNLVINTQPMQEAEYITSTFVRPDLDTTGIFLASEVSVFEYDRTHRTRIGYEWRRADIIIRFRENRANLYGTNVAFARADYYQDLELKQAKKQDYFTVTYKGKNYSCTAFYEDMGYYYESDGSFFQMTCYVQVPIGYDGVVLAFHHGNLDINGMHLQDVEDENMLLFRMA